MWAFGRRLPPIRHRRPTRSPSIQPHVLAAAPAWLDAGRERAFNAWFDDVATEHRLRADSLRPAPADASFRRYFRVDASDGGSLIVMDAPPPEDVRRFVAIAALLASAALPAARVLAEDAGHGFLLLSDLGDDVLLGALQRATAAGDQHRADVLMRRAASLLADFQRGIDAAALPGFDDALLRRDLDLFTTWCVQREHGVAWSADESTVWQDACTALMDEMTAQPQVAVHRDYMPRNLMVLEGSTGDPGPALGILDFQDAVRGPIAYDMASLLRDAYIGWDEAQEIDWAVRYWQAARKTLPLPDDFGEYWRQVEWCGLQRHLKILGIFCRLKHRDGKPGYMSELPRFYAHAHKVASRYNRLRPLSRLLEPLMGAERLQVYY